MKRKSCIIDLQICVYYAYIYIYILLRISKLHSCQIFFIFQTFSKSKNERNVHKLRWIKKKKKQPSKSLVDKNFEKQESFLIHTRIIYIVSNAKEIRSSQKSYCRKNSIFHSIFCAIIIRKNLYIEKKIEQKEEKEKKRKKRTNGETFKPSV